MVKLNKLNCPNDIAHIGEVFARVREHRGIPKTRLAEKCRISRSTISRLEKDGTGRHPTRRRDEFECLLNVLRDLSRVPLKDIQVEILLKLFNSSLEDEVSEKQHQIAGINFEEIASTNKPKELERLVNWLRIEKKPALIMDPLWFIHAVNGALFRLFDIDPQSNYLYRWEAWHVLASKFCPESPVREAHYNHNLYFPPAVDQFFANRASLPFLFTIQMRWLLCRIHHLSKQNNYNFTAWWEAATSFSIDYEEDVLNRILLYKKETILLEAKWRPEQSVEIDPGREVFFIPVVWEPKDPNAEYVFNHIRRDDDEIYFATDYDRENKFHVNTWEEVMAEL